MAMKNDEYLQNAAEAQELASKAKTDSDREAWLRIAENWLSLMKRRPPTDQERFEESARANGTGQDISDSSP